MNDPKITPQLNKIITAFAKHCQRHSDRIEVIEDYLLSTFKMGAFNPSWIYSQEEKDKLSYEPHKPKIQREEISRQRFKK